MTHKFGESGKRMEVIVKTRAVERRMRRGPNTALKKTQKTPLNIMAMFSAVGSQDAASKLKPRAPRRSARPTLSRRLFMVAMLAPRKTPRIPMYGCVESAAGGLAGVAGVASCRASITGLAPRSIVDFIGANSGNNR